MISPPTWLDCHSVAKWLLSLREMECSPRGLTSIFNSLDIISPVRGRSKNRAQRIDVRRYGIDSLDVEIYGLVIIRGRARGRRREGRLVSPRRERAGRRTSFGCGRWSPGERWRRSNEGCGGCGARVR